VAAVTADTILLRKCISVITIYFSVGKCVFFCIAFKILILLVL
jgi:hypothetical protein